MRLPRPDVTSGLAMTTGVGNYVPPINCYGHNGIFCSFIAPDFAMFT